MVGRGNSTLSVDKVHIALLGLKPKSVSIPAGTSPIPHITAAKVKAVVRRLTTEVEEVFKRRRLRYLYWLLVQLNGEGRLTFRLPVESVEQPPRALAFDPLNPYLPSVTRFRKWQHHLADLALGVRPPRSPNNTQALSAKCEDEFRALATLLAYGGVCGSAALKTAARFVVPNLNENMTVLAVHDKDGYRIFALALHPIQTLALMRYTRRGGGSVAAAGTEGSEKHCPTSFPVLRPMKGSKAS